MTQRVLKVLTCILIAKVTVSIVLNYLDYLPPDFNSDFLRGREAYFFGSYMWAFYVHLASGPCTLILGLILLNDRFRLRLPKWHRILGRMQVAGILLMLVPSGLWMASHAATGMIAGMGFAALSLATGACALLGWRAAVQRRFVAHRVWMWRCYLLLCSAVVLRLIGGLVVVTQAKAEWLYPLAAWTSWTVPLAPFELNRYRNRVRSRSLAPTARRQYVP